jgi:hypothetical protein
MMGFFKTINQPPPPEVFNNSEHHGSFKMGDAWIDIAELFFLVFRAGGMIKVRLHLLDWKLMPS